MNILQLVEGVDLTGFACNNGKVEEGEHSVGEMSEGLKKIYKLFVQSADRLKVLIEKGQKSREEHDKLHEAGEVEDDRCEAHTREMFGIISDVRTAHREHDAWNEFFWNAARLEHPKLLGKNIIVRDGFVLVWDRKRQTKGEGIAGLAGIILEMGGLEGILGTLGITGLRR